MIKVRKSNERGHFQHGWLDTRHTFSFADYYNSEHMGFSALRVINEDIIDASQGFPFHSHRDMEIITYVVDGALEHKDSMGNAAVIRPGEVQRMSAGTGVSHSEFNSLPDRETHLLQIWVLPNKTGFPQVMNKKDFTNQFAKNPFVLVASEKGRESSVSLHQDTDMYVAHLQRNQDLSYEIRPRRNIWVQMIKGDLRVNDRDLHAGDGAAISEEEKVHLLAKQDCEFILFDLP